MTDAVVALEVGAMLRVLVPLLVFFLGLNAGVIAWLINQLTRALTSRLSGLEDKISSEVAKVNDVERSLLQLRADLPVQFVRREDWIRYGSVIDAKQDALRADVHVLGLRLEKAIARRRRATDDTAGEEERIDE